MTYFNQIYKFMWPILIGIVAIISNESFAVVVNSTFTVDNLTFTASYDNVQCLGQPFNINFFISSSGPQLNSGYHFRGFVPSGSVAGLGCPTVLPPSPDSYISFSSIAGVPSNCNGNPLGTFCNTADPNTGDWELTSPFPVNISYQMQVQFVASECGLQQYSTCVNYNDVADGPVSFCQLIAISIVPVAQLPITNTGTYCQNTPEITGLLAPPLCLPQPGCTACAGCGVCTAFTGPCGPYPFHYETIGSSTGGSVTITDQTGGVYSFVPDGSFGTASFGYTVISDFSPPIFCSPTANGYVNIAIVQNPVILPTEFTVCAGQFITGNLNTAVTGPTGNFGFVLDSTTCTGLTLNPSGIFSFTAPTGPGSCIFNFTVTDVNPPSCSASGIATITINEAPVPIDQAIITCINNPISGVLTASGGQAPYTFALTGVPVGGNVVLDDPSTGAFTFTPTCPAGCTGSFTFSVTDVNGCPSLADGTVTITVNTPVIPGTGALSGCQNTTLVGTLTGLITGGTGPFIFGAIGAVVGGSVDVNSNGTFSFFPNLNYTGPASFNFAVTGDSCSPSGFGTVFIDIGPAPSVTSARFDICPDIAVTGDLVNYLLSASGPTVSFTSVGAPTNGNLTLAPTGPFTFTPTPPGFSGAAGFNFQAIDSNLSCQSNVARVNVIVHPKPTTITGLFGACSNGVVEGNLANGLVIGESPFFFTLNGAPVGGTVNLESGGFFTFTPNVPGPAVGSFGYGVTSSFGCTAVGEVDFNINQSPTATTGSNLACGGVPVTGTLVPLVSLGTPPYFFSVVSQTNGVASVGVNSGIYIFTPNNGVTGGSFVFAATDQNGCSATGEIDVNVNPGPQASNGAFTGCAGVTSINGTLTGLVTGGSGTLTFSPTGIVPTCGIVTVNPDGTFTFVPNPGFVGSCIFQYAVQDSGVPSCNDVGTVTVTVDESPFASGATFNACQDTLFTGNLNGFVSGGFPPFMFFQTGVAPVCGTVNVMTGGTFTYQPAPAFIGPCSFNWFVEDSTPCSSNTATATINVNPTPVAGDTGPFNICENSKATGNLNPLMSVGTPLYTFNAFNSINGSVSLNPAGPFTFNPTPNYTGPASFQFRGRDSLGCLSNTGTVSYNVNDAPTITGDSPLNSCQNVPVEGTVTASGGTPGYTFAVVSATHGSANITLFTPTTADFTFTPDLNFIGNAVVVIGVTDSLGCSLQVAITIIVRPNPVVSSTSVQSCQPVVFGSLTGLVSGGTPPFNFGLTGVPTCGAVTINPNGTFVYTGPVGPCTFDFVVTDNTPSMCFGTGSFTIAQTATGAPIATDGLFCSCFNTPVSGNLSNFVSGGIPPYLFQIVGTPVGGTVIVNPITGFFIFKPTPGFIGFASFQFIVKDSSNIFCQSNIGTITIQVPCCPGTGLTAPTGTIPG